jgi:hypothetical protein
MIVSMSSEKKSLLYRAAELRHRSIASRYRSEAALDAGDLPAFSEHRHVSSLERRVSTSFRVQGERLER